MNKLSEREKEFELISLTIQTAFRINEKKWYEFCVTEVERFHKYQDKNAHPRTVNIINRTLGPEGIIPIVALELYYVRLFVLNHKYIDISTEGVDFTDILATVASGEYFDQLVINLYTI